MPSQKDFKRLVRARMRKTGEAYTAARARLLAKPSRSRTGKKTARPTAPAVDYGKLAGMSDAVVKEKTGCTWERWVHALDRYGAAEMPHREIVDLIHTKYKTDGWWSQMVTVGYERIRGLRARGQRRDGSYEATKSRTFNVPVDALHRAFANATLRKRWLAEPGVRVRTSRPPKSIRLGFVDGSIVAAGFTPKGNAKSVVALSHAKLPTREAAERVKRYWTERFAALADALG
jgi:uncharacterized protein YndB with AHSA1/START domain